MTLQPQPLQLLAAATHAAQAELDRLRAALATAQADAAGIEAQIAAGAGIDDPALFGQRRDLVDLVAFLRGQIEQAQKVLANAKGAERRAREDLAALQGRLHGERKQLADLGARVAQALHTGNTQRAAQYDAQRRWTEQRIERMVQSLGYLENDPA